ncbi:hypothetical protein GGR53DRAFT_463800 [Hypoxylon sp. FL1150]|nr:hypothetical protein GGR53DRAFT_463800 [Hypoxylon sp. FL1150]
MAEQDQAAKSRLIKVAVGHHRRSAWARAIFQVLSFIKCHEDCSDIFNCNYYDRNNRRYVGDRETVLYDILTPTYSKGIIRNGRGDEGFDRDSCPAGEAHESSVPAGNATSSEIGLLNLPAVIFTQIFEYVVGNYELKEYLNRPRTRAWADLTNFLVCRAFHKLAIEYYGMPHYQTVPFSPSWTRW